MSPDGVTAGHISVNTATSVALVVMSAIAFYNVLELLLLILATFKRYHGLYFWSMTIASLGCLLHGLGFVLKFYELVHQSYISVTVITIGWYAMVTGQSVVLYSRLHLVVTDRTLRQRVLYMIIFDAVVFHIPTTVLTFGSNASPAVAAYFVHPYAVMEKIQMTAFCLQEFAISTIYVRATYALLRTSFNDQKRRLMMRLIGINVLIIGLDIVLLAVEYANLYDIEVVLKSMIYSVKLKLEFSVLGQLMDLTKQSFARTTRLTTFVRSGDPPQAQKQSIPADVSGLKETQQPSDMPPTHGIRKTGGVEVSWLEEKDEQDLPRLLNLSASERPAKPQSVLTEGYEANAQDDARYSSDVELEPGRLQMQHCVEAGNLHTAA